MPRIAQGETVGRVALRKRGKWWQARYSTPTGRVEEHMHVTSIEVARRKAGEINALLERGEHAALESLRAGQQVTFRVLVEEWKSTYTGWGPRTKAGAEGLINILVSTWGDMPLAHVNTKLINGYLAHRQAKGLAPATCNRYLSFLRRLFHCAVSWNYLARSPAAEVRFLKVQGKVPDALKEEQLEGLLAHLVDRHRPMVIVAVDTGLRRSEILELTWADVDWGSARSSFESRRTPTGEWFRLPTVRLVFYKRCGRSRQRLRPSASKIGSFTRRTSAKVWTRPRRGPAWGTYTSTSFATPSPPGCATAGYRWTGSRNCWDTKAW